MVQLIMSNPVGTRLPDIYVSSTFTAYDSLNNAVIPTVNVTNVTESRTTLTLRSPVDCRPNQVITSAGVYTFVYSVKMSDGDVQEFRQDCLISPTP